jgi:DNA processing protein
MELIFPIAIYFSFVAGGDVEMTTAWEEDIWTEEEQSYWLAFDQLSGPGLGAVKLRSLFELHHSLKPIWHADRDMLIGTKALSRDGIEQFLQKRKEIEPAEILAKLKNTDIKAFPLMHPSYPFRLREIFDPPLVLYMRGELSPEDITHAAGVVGTRKPTSYGQRLAKEFARSLSGAGVAVISGMAIGIDSLAHYGAIEGGGKTVAVLACGVDVCYPSSNRPLFQKLVEGRFGAVVSEFAPGTRPEQWRFPARNRIISGLSEAVVVIEAGETSGSLITAKIAFEQNREVFAVPGRIDSVASKGCHKIIKEQTAQLCTGVDDVMEKMRWVSVKLGREVPTVVQLFGREKEVFELLSNEPMHFDHISERSGIPAPELSATLTMLELAGVVTRHTGDWYSRDR